MTLTLYALPHPSRATRVAWALEEVGADWELVALAHDDARLRALNPLAKVPVLQDGDLLLRESGAILAYLGERFPASGLIPADPRDRARCWQWMLFVLTELEQACWLKAKHRFALPERYRVPAVNDAAAYEFARCAEVLEAELQGRAHLVGGRFTAADLLVTHTVLWGRRAGFEVPAGLGTFAATHVARPAFARASERERGARAME